MSDEYLDAAGNGVAVTDEKNQVLTIGDPKTSAKEGTPHYLRFFTSDRPSVFHADKSEHKVGYLSDLGLSVYTMGHVDVVVEKPDELTGTPTDTDPLCNVTREIGTGRVARWQATPGPGYENVPGLYTSDYDSATPTGIIWDPAETQKALVRNSGQTNWVPDGRCNADFPSTGNTMEVLLTQVTDAAHDYITWTYPATGADKWDGTMLRMNNGDIGKVQEVFTGADGLKYVKLIRYTGATTGLGIYTLPQCYTFDATNGWKAGKLVDVPGTFDGWVHDVTYQWSGYHKIVPSALAPGKVHYVNSWANWTAHHEDTTTMLYDGQAWAFTDLLYDDMRNQEQQDNIDDKLLEVASISPDYVELEKTIEVQLPEWPAPKTMSNPAYIHNKPWTAVALIDGGNFIDQPDHFGWLADGGDFTGISGSIPANYQNYAAVPSGQMFANSIYKLMHGENYDLMPDVGLDGNHAPTPEGTKAIYAHVMRWVQENKSLYFSDGAALYRFLPTVSTSGPVNGIEFNPGSDSTTLDIKTETVDTSNPALPAQLVPLTVNWDSEKKVLPDSISQYKVTTLDTQPASGGQQQITLDSPFMDKLVEILTPEAAQQSKDLVLCWDSGLASGPGYGWAEVCYPTP